MNDPAQYKDWILSANEMNKPLTRSTPPPSHWILTLEPTRLADPFILEFFGPTCEFLELLVRLVTFPYGWIEAIDRCPFSIVATDYSHTHHF